MRGGELAARGQGLTLPPPLAPLTRRPPAALCAAAFDVDRQDLLDRVEACASATPAEVYKLQAENRKRTDEVRELQKVRGKQYGAASRAPQHPPVASSPPSS